MTELGDDRLRDVFRAERASDQAWIPSFERVRAARAVHRRRGWLPALGFVCLVTVLVAVGLLRRNPIPPLVRMRVGELRAPTDFLLNLPGAELLETVPEIGNPSGWYPLGRPLRRNGS